MTNWPHCWTSCAWTGASLDDVISEALRRGLRAMAVQPKPSRPFHTRSVDLGRVLIAKSVSIAEVLAIAEGEAFG
jgi:hypothetical protein